MSTSKRLYVTQRLSPSAGGSGFVYAVKKVVNETTPKPGEVIDEQALRSYCASVAWDVTIT